MAAMSISMLLPAVAFGQSRDGGQCQHGDGRQRGHSGEKAAAGKGRAFTRKHVQSSWMSN